jgi:hypothetical protein
MVSLEPQEEGHLPSDAIFFLLYLNQFMLASAVKKRAGKKEKKYMMRKQ